MIHFYWKSRQICWLWTVSQSYSHIRSLLKIRLSKSPEGGPDLCFWWNRGGLSSHKFFPPWVTEPSAIFWVALSCCRPNTRKPISYMSLWFVESSAILLRWPKRTTTHKSNDSLETRIFLACAVLLCCIIHNIGQGRQQDGVVFWPEGHVKWESPLV